MSEERSKQIASLERAVLEGDGVLSAQARRAFAYEQPIAAPYQTWIGQVRQAASGCTDAMVDELKSAGESEEAIYEATHAAALGAGLHRLRAARRALGLEEGS